MSIRYRRAGLALGGLLVLVIVLTPGSYAQQNAQKPPAVVDEGQERVVEPPIPKDSGGEGANDQQGATARAVSMNAESF